MVSKMAIKMMRLAWMSTWEASDSDSHLIKGEGQTRQYAENDEEKE